MRSTVYHEWVDAFIEKYANAAQEDLRPLQTPDPKFNNAPVVKKIALDFMTVSSMK